MPLGSRTDPYLGARFFVEIEGVDQGGFTECTGLQAEDEVTDYQEGGNNGFVHKLLGRAKHGSVKLTRHLSGESTGLATETGQFDASIAALQVPGCQPPGGAE